MYMLRFPFELPPGREIAADDSPTFSIGDLAISLTRDDRFYVLEIRGFKSATDAEDFIASVQSGLMWLLLNRGLASVADYVSQPVTIADDPAQTARNLSNSCGGIDFGDEVHGIIDSARPAVLPTDGSFRRITGQPVTLRITTPVTDIIEYLVYGMTVPFPAGLCDDQRLLTALELYGAYYSENSERAKFITLVMVLEALAEPTLRPQTIVEFLNSVRDMVEARLDGIDDASEEAVAFKSLQQEILFRRHDSIRAQVRTLVLRTLEGDDDIKEVSRQALTIYDRRCQLLHDGILNPTELR